MSQENEIEAKKLSPTTDFLPSDGASCSASWVYHYAAIYQQSPGGINYIDGIATRTGRIDNYEQYQELKKAISNGDVDPSKITITSLTLLHAPNV